jgi:hypothetical protein
MKHPQGVEIDDYGFTIVDLTNVGHKNEPWILAATIAQVFYILDPKDEKKIHCCFWKTMSCQSQRCGG